MSLPHGAWFPSIFSSLSHETKECTMSRTRQYVKKQAKAITRRRLGAKERHERQQKRARRDMEAMSAATRSRWQWTWALDDSVFRKYGDQLELVGTWWSGQHKRVVDGIDGVLLLVVIGDGKLIVPVDFAVRRPNPTGPGRRCRTKLGWAQVMLDETLAALRRRGLDLPAPLVVAESSFSNSKLMAHVADTHHVTLLGQGKSTCTK